MFLVLRLEWTLLNEDHGPPVESFLSLPRDSGIAVSHDSHDSHGSHDSHDSHGSHDIHGSHDSHDSHDSHGSHDSHRSHGSRGSHGDHCIGQGTSHGRIHCSQWVANC